MAPATVAYTSYMQALSLRGGPLEIMAALLPCAWSYVEIATRLRVGTDAAHPVYGDWIAYFSRPDVVDMVGAMRRDFDALLAEEGSNQVRERALADVFATSSRLERAFWEMAYTFEQWPDLGDA
jgi:thiaminase/transcriptional activator TenA